MGNRKATAKAFAETDSPLGLYFAGLLCDVHSRERFDYMKQSSDRECRWAQGVYARYFDPDDETDMVEKDEKMYLELIEKDAAQKNPQALCRRGVHHYNSSNYKEALVDYRMAAELGWRFGKEELYRMFYYGRRVKKDLVQAVHWCCKDGSLLFGTVLGTALKAWNDKAFGDLGCDFNRLAMEIGKGLYWYQYGAESWEKRDQTNKVFGIKCLDYYCETIELRQESIFLFLLFWNKTTGVKGPGRMIGQIVWEGRYDCLVKELGEEERG